MDKADKFCIWLFAFIIASSLGKIIEIEHDINKNLSLINDQLEIISNQGSATEKS